MIVRIERSHFFYVDAAGTYTESFGSGIVGNGWSDYDCNSANKHWSHESRLGPRHRIGPLQNSQQFGQHTEKRSKSLPSQFGQKYDHNSARNSYQSMSREEANLFFRVVSYRYQKGSTIITTNKGIGSWPGVLAGDEVLAGAILDRLLHSATVLNIQGRSYRLKDLESSLANPSQTLDKPASVAMGEPRASC